MIFPDIQPHRTYKDGEPCSHPGCLSHVSHPCEGCGRIGGRSLSPCPYHDPTKPDCGKRKNCPLLLFDAYVVCTALNLKQIVMVRSWVEGRTPDPKEEAEA